MGLTKFRKYKTVNGDYINMDVLNNANALLSECLTNGNDGMERLHAWFAGERDLIEQTLMELEDYNGL